VQGAQEAAPGRDEQVPGEHGTQVDASEAPELLLNVAGGQTVHDASDTAAAVVLYVPEGHREHCAAPGVSL
jgi:hypothetical protein